MDHKNTSTTASTTAIPTSSPSIETSEAAVPADNAAPNSQSQVENSVESTAANEVIAPTSAQEGDLGKIQDILFGTQLRAINQKIMLVHKDFKQSITELEKKLTQSLNSQEDFTRTEFIKLTEKLRAERKARENTQVSSGQGLTEIEDRINSMEKAQTTNKSALEEQLRNTIKDLEKSLDETRNELQNQIDNHKNSLQDDKVSRVALSELLGGIAQQINPVDAKPGVDDETNIPTVTESIPTVTELSDGKKISPIQAVQNEAAKTTDS